MITITYRGGFGAAFEIPRHSVGQNLASLRSPSPSTGPQHHEEVSVLAGDLLLVNLSYYITLLEGLDIVETRRVYITPTLDAGPGMSKVQSKELEAMNAATVMKNVQGCNDRSPLLPFEPLFEVLLGVLLEVLLELLLELLLEPPPFPEMEPDFVEGAPL